MESDEFAVLRAFEVWMMIEKMSKGEDLSCRMEGFI